ncbi:hypothetical protein [Nitratidesulfovibrio sp. 1201_IL3209]
MVWFYVALALIVGLGFGGWAGYKLGLRVALRMVMEEASRRNKGECNA